MLVMNVLDVEVTLDDNCKDMPLEEVKTYVRRMLPETKGQKLLKLYIRLEEGSENVFLDVTCTSDTKFDRIRRITGYLVGSINRFNNAKAAEERDRVKHSFGLY